MNIAHRVWMDTETTKLSIWRRAWDVALIVRTTEPTEQGGREYVDHEYQWFVHPIDIELERADPKALEIGQFWERHPHGAILIEMGARSMLANGRIGDLLALDLRTLPTLTRVRRAGHIARDVHGLTRCRAPIYGSNPGFDMLTLEHMLSEEGLTADWHYHPNDVPNLIEGWLIGRGCPERIPTSRRSEDYCRAVDIEPNNYARHSALGDCQLFRDAFDAMYGGLRS